MERVVPGICRLLGFDDQPPFYASSVGEPNRKSDPEASGAAARTS